MGRHGEACGCQPERDTDMALDDKSAGVFRRIDQRVRREMEITGVEFEGNAKKLNTYTDRTSNLRNSIGSEVKDISDGHQLTMLAGMNYAAAVEAKGFDVISGPKNIAVENFKTRVKKALRDEAG